MQKNIQLAKDISSIKNLHLLTPNDINTQTHNIELVINPNAINIVSLRNSLWKSCSACVYTNVN